MSNYDAQVTVYDVIDDVAEERRWLGTITTGEVTFSFVQKDDGIERAMATFAPIINDQRLLLYMPDGRRVYWSKEKDAKNIRQAVNAAIRKAQAVYRLVYRAEREPQSCSITINPDSVVYEDKGGTTVYPRHEDGSVDATDLEPIPEEFADTADANRDPNNYSGKDAEEISPSTLKSA